MKLFNEISVEKTKPNTLRQLFFDQLSDLYSAEKQLIRALPKMSKAATSEQLKSAFDEHYQITQEHASRIERIFEQLDEKPISRKCKGMEGLLEEGEETIKKKDETDIIKDADLIAAAQRVEHYEIAGYGTVRTFAEMLGLEEAVQILQQTLDEEGDADKTLTAISEELLSDADVNNSVDESKYEGEYEDEEDEDEEI